MKQSPLLSRTCKIVSHHELKLTLYLRSLLKNRRQGVNISLSILLGVERSNPSLFELNLPLLLHQVEVAAGREDVS